MKQQALNTEHPQKRMTQEEQLREQEPTLLKLISTLVAVEKALED
jgi:hypothetical protein